MTRLALLALVLLPVSMGPQDTGASVCRDSVRLARLARINDAADAELIRIQSDVWCSTRERDRDVTWPGNRAARLPSGAWNYPDGRVAKTSGGVWKYANGQTARGSSGAWNYPSGRPAKFESGRWQRPDGRPATESELLLWACQRLGDGQCRRPLAEIRALSGFDKDLAIIELAWAAR
jgi:hypothetical protein